MSVGPEQCDGCESVTRQHAERWRSLDTGSMKNLILLSQKRAARGIHRYLLLLVLALLLLSAYPALAQQPAVDASKDVVRIATGKADVAGDAAPQPKQAIDYEAVDSVVILRTARVIFVRSHSILVKGAVVEEKLQKRPEFQQFGLVITRDADAADLILELRHDLFTKYVYTAVDTKTQTLVASGKLSSLGGTVADKVARRFLKQVGQARLSSDSVGKKD
jgi:hypothetical protein